MLNSIGNQYFNYNISSAPLSSAKKQTSSTSYCEPNPQAQPSFSGISDFWKSRIMKQTGATSDDKKMYSKILKNLDEPTKKNFNKLVDSGIILQRNSNDGSSVLENLYKIMSNPRHEGLETSKILSQTINTLAFPYIITQDFGDIPAQKVPEMQAAASEPNPNQPPEGTTLQDCNVGANSSCCVAASIEFSLAHKKPAEFARMVEGLTGVEPQVISKVQLDKITDKMADSLRILDDFKVDYIPVDWNNVEVKIKPDKNAILRAQIQNDFQDPNERSSIDVMLQSAFMNFGSEDSYNSLIDRRYGPLSTNNDGLTEFEKTFVETIVNNESKISLTYQIVDDNQNIAGYNYDFNTIQQHLTDALKGGSDVIIGITETDENNHIIGGHEITVTDFKQDANGELSFVCNDTDDGASEAVVKKASELIPKIHHAGIPTKLINLPIQEEIGYQILHQMSETQNVASIQPQQTNEVSAPQMSPVYSQPLAPSVA